jgi:hypothetical protein
VLAISHAAIFVSSFSSFFPVILLELQFLLTLLQTYAGNFKKPMYDVSIGVEFWLEVYHMGSYSQNLLRENVFVHKRGESGLCGVC